MANITHEQLIEYDAQIKTYINNSIDSKMVYYTQKIQELTNTITILQNTIADLKNNTDKDLNNYISPINNTVTLKNGNGAPLLRSIKPETIVVEEDIEEDYIVYDRIIFPNDNKQYKNIVVTTDDRSNRIWFSMWKTFDDRELDTQDKVISIIWINADGLKGESVCGDKEIIPGTDRLYFSWNIPNNCTTTAGTIQYAIRIVGPNYAWHTLPATIQCVQGLMDGNWQDIPDAQAGIDWADYIEDKWAEKLVILTQPEYDAIEEKKDIVYVVIYPDQTIKMYLGTKPITSSGDTTNFDIRYNSDTKYLQKTVDGTTWTDVVMLNSSGNISNIVSLTSQQYSELPEVDPATLYLLKD